MFVQVRTGSASAPTQSVVARRGGAPRQIAAASRRGESHKRGRAALGDVLALRLECSLGSAAPRRRGHLSRQSAAALRRGLLLTNEPHFAALLLAPCPILAVRRAAKSLRAEVPAGSWVTKRGVVFSPAETRTLEAYASANRQSITAGGHKLSADFLSALGLSAEPGSLPRHTPQEVWGALHYLVGGGMAKTTSGAQRAASAIGAFFSFLPAPRSLF